MTSLAESSRAPWAHPIGATITTTALVTALSYGMPVEHAASAVGLAFLGATYWLTLRTDDPDAARHHGLSLGGLLDPEPLDVRRLLRSAAAEGGWAVGLGALVFPVFWIGYLVWWAPVRGFSFPHMNTAAFANEVLGQLLVIAIPEEAFYRGYLQTRLDLAWPPRWRLLGAPIGPSVVVTSALFALGHLATDPHPSRLAVFFPSLLFGWLRSKRGGIGASAAFHASCNLFASFLARSYGFSS